MHVLCENLLQKRNVQKCLSLYFGFIFLIKFKGRTPICFGSEVENSFSNADVVVISTE